MTTDTPNRRQFLQRSAGTALTAVGIGALSTTASAEDRTGGQGLLADGFDVEPDRDAFITGYLDGFSDQFGRFDAPDELANDMANEFNANTDAWLSYGNWLLEEAGVTAAGSATVAVEVGISRIPFRDVEDAVETHITTEYDSDAGEFNDLEWVDEPTDDADFEVALHNLAAENGDGELFEFRSEYIDTDGDHELPDDAYLNRLAGKYGGVVGVGEESMTVFDILLGGVNR